MKIELYTCKDGIYLLDNKEAFFAWEKDSPAYKTYGRIKILVDETDAVPCLDMNGKDVFEILNIDSVEVVDDNV